MRTLWGRIAGLAFVMACVVLVIPPAQAVPNFASQTGQPCTACHIGAFGPQLTPLGRAFKIGGYTQRGGEGWQADVPLSAMVLAIVHPHRLRRSSRSDRRITSMTTTISPWTRSACSLPAASASTPAASCSSPIPISRTRRTLDNVDLRPYTTTFDLSGKELRVGTTINNNPTVQDPYNSTFAWGFPYCRLGPGANADRGAGDIRWLRAATRSATRRMPGTTTACTLKAASTRRCPPGR